MTVPLPQRQSWQIGSALRAVVRGQTPEAQSATQWKWNSSMPTNLRIVPRLLSFAAAAFVLVVVVKLLANVRLWLLELSGWRTTATPIERNRGKRGRQTTGLRTDRTEPEIHIDR